MTGNASPQCIHSVVSDMESDVRDVRGFAHLLLGLGTSDHVHPKGLHILGSALDELAIRLERQYDLAFQVAVEAKR